MFFDRAQWTLDRHVPELGRSLGEELLRRPGSTPRRLALIDAVEVHAISHVTGGGLANNLARVIPGSCEARIDRTTWQPPPIFSLIPASARCPSRPGGDAHMGVGMVVVLPADAAMRGFGPARRPGVAGLGLRLGRPLRVGHSGAGQPVRLPPSLLSRAPSAAPPAASSVT